MFRPEDWLRPKVVEKYDNLIRNTLHNMSDDVWGDAFLAFQYVEEIVYAELHRRDSRD